MVEKRKIFQRAIKSLRLKSFVIVIILVNSIVFYQYILQKNPEEDPRDTTSLERNSSQYFELPDVPPVQHKLIKLSAIPKTCQNNNDQDIIIIVHSSVNNFENRKVLRETIGKHKSYNKFSTSLVFVTGESLSREVMNNLHKEQEIFNDILTIKMLDSYNKMVYKAVGWMKWFTSSCKGAKFVIKIDDDTFINMFKISQLYRKCSSKVPPEICHKVSCLLWKGFKPHRKGKYMLTMSEYSKDSFPDFCPGTAIFYPKNVIKRLLEATEHVQYLWLDDVYVTGLLMDYIGEKHYNFGDKILSTLIKTYNDIKNDIKYVAHFSNNVNNGVYKEFWKIIEHKHLIQVSR